MKNFFKVLFIAGCFGLLVLVGAVVALRILYPPEKIKALVVEKIEKQLGRSVKVGEVSLGLFTGITIKDFKVSESKDFSKGTFIKSRSFVLKPDLLALLKKKFVINRVALEAPHISVIKFKNGLFNFEDLTTTNKKTIPSAQSTAPSRQAQKQPWDFFVDNVVINKGTLTYQDKTSPGTDFKIHDITLEARALALKKAFPLTLSMVMEGKFAGTPVAGSLDFDGEFDLADLETSKMSAKIKKLALEAQGVGVELAGRVDNLITPNFNLKATLRSLNWKKLQHLVSFPSELTLKGNPKASFEVKGSTKDFTVSALVDLAPMEIHLKDVFTKTSGTPMELSVTSRLWHLKDLKIAPLKIVVGEANLYIKGTLKSLDTDNTKIDITISSPPMEISELMKLSPQAKGYHVGGKAQVKKILVKGTSRSPRISGMINVDNVHFQYEGSKLTSVSGKISFTPNKLRLPHLSGRLDGHPLKLEVTVLHYKKAPDIRVAGSLVVLDLGKMFPSTTEAANSTAASSTPPPPPSKDTGPPLKMQGKFVIGKVLHPNFTADDLVLTWNLRGVTPSLYKLSGKTTLNVQGGKIKDIDKLLKQNKIAKTILMPVFVMQKAGKLNLFKKVGLSKVIKMPSFSNIRYKKISGDYIFKKGLATIKKFQIQGTTFDMNTQGTIHLVKETLHLNTSIKVLGGFLRGALGGILADETGVPTVSMKITGTLSNPKVKPDLMDTGRKIIGEVFKQIPGLRPKKKKTASSGDKATDKEEDVEKLLKKGKDLFKGIFK